MVDRKYAATNPAAYFHGRPITLAEHAASRWIVEPLRLLNCTRRRTAAKRWSSPPVERARELPHPPAVITAAAQGAGRAQEQKMTSFYRDELTGLPEMGVVARQLWRTSGLTPTDIDVGILYDHFTPFVLMQLEEFGFCKPGEAADFVAEERLPLNTQRGATGEAVPARDERGGGGRSPAARHVREPDTGRRSHPGHRGHGGPHVGVDPGGGRGMSTLWGSPRSPHSRPASRSPRGPSGTSRVVRRQPYCLRPYGSLGVNPQGAGAARPPSGGGASPPPPDLRGHLFGTCGRSEKVRVTPSVEP